MKIEDRIKKVIKKSNNVFIMGHKNLDLDAIGACIGVKAICDYFNKDSYIIIDDKENELSVAKVLEEVKDEVKITTSDDIADFCKNNSTLVIVDTNKTNMVQNDRILHYFANIIVIDHHQETDQTINGINIINESKSSACEMVANLIERYKAPLNEHDATIVLSGIVLDTNNFIKKTKSETYYAACFLTALGANPKKVQYYLKENLKDYIIRNKVIVNTELLNGKYAITVGDSNTVYKREELAKIADTLLNFNSVLASFVIGNREDGGIGISARSEGKVNVGKITEKLGGGGDNFNAASVIQNSNLEEVKKELIKVLNEEE